MPDEALPGAQANTRYQHDAEMSGALRAVKPAATREVAGIVDAPFVTLGRYTEAMPKQKRPFVVEIEAKLTVQAFDGDSARKKVERAFATGRPLGVDVSPGAGVWTYAVVSQQDAPQA